jgi:hypothetical protein
MDVLVLRLIHIGFGAFWVGAVFTNVLFLQPTAAALGPDGGRFQFHLLRHRSFATVILASAAATVLAGVVLLWITTNGLDPGRAFAASRLGFTLGGIVGVLTFALGSLYVYPRTRRIVAVMAGVMDAARPPTPEEQAELGRIRSELVRAGWGTVIGLGITVAAMATARLWGAVL